METLSSNPHNLAPSSAPVSTSLSLWWTCSKSILFWGEELIACTCLQTFWVIMNGHLWFFFYFLKHITNNAVINILVFFNFVSLNFFFFYSVEWIPTHIISMWMSMYIFNSNRCRQITFPNSVPIYTLERKKQYPSLF